MILSRVYSLSHILHEDWLLGVVDILRLRLLLFIYLLKGLVIRTMSTYHYKLLMVAAL